MSNVPENLFIDPDLIKQAYLKAFEDIEFPENFQDFERTQIESREPGTAITARIWNDTINELRNICRALAVWMREYNEGVDAALDEFTKKINDVIQYLLEVGQQELVQWLMRATFNVAFEEPDENSCYLVFTISDGTPEGTVVTRSGNLKSNQIFWMVSGYETDPDTGEYIIDPDTGEKIPIDPEPKDSEGNPIWRIKLETSEFALPDSLVTHGDLENAIDDLISEEDADNKYALKSEVGEKSNLSPIAADTVWGGIEEVYGLVGAKPAGSEIQSDTVWDALEEINLKTLDTDTTNTLLSLADSADDLLALESAVSDLQINVGNAQTDITNLDDALQHNTNVSNTDFKALYNSIIELQAVLLTGTADTTSGLGNIWVVDKSNTNQWVRRRITTAANSFSFNNGNYGSCLNTSRSSITATFRAGWCHLKMNLFFKATSHAVNNSFVVPVLALPVWARPYVSGFDIPCISQVTSSNEAYLRIIAPDNKTYSTPLGNRQFTVPTIVLNRFMNGSGSNIKIPENDTFIKAEISYPVLNICDNGAGVATAVFTDPHYELI